MEINRTHTTIEILSRLNSIIFNFLVIVLFVNCNSENKLEKYKGYALVEVYNIEGDNFNINLYLLDKYKTKNELKTYLKEVNEMQCLIITIDKQSDKYEYYELCKMDYTLDNINFKLVFIDFEISNMYMKDNFSFYDSNIIFENNNVELNIRHYIEKENNFDIKQFSIIGNYQNTW